MSLGDFSMHHILEDECEVKSNLNVLGMPWGLERTLFFLHDVDALPYMEMLTEAIFYTEYWRVVFAKEKYHLPQTFVVLEKYRQGTLSCQS